MIMAVATDERTPSGVAPFVLGATVYAGALVTGPLTGGSFNPARSLGPAVAGGGWIAHWLYWVAPTLGMVAGMRSMSPFAGQAPSVSRRPGRRTEWRGRSTDSGPSVGAGPRRGATLGG